MRIKNYQIPILSIVLIAISSVIYFRKATEETPYNKYSRLMSAITDDDLPSAEDGLKHGVDPNFFPQDRENENDIAPLCHAIRIGDIKMIQLLIDWHADPNVEDGSNYTPLIVAAEHNRVDILKLLILKGAKVNGDWGSMSLWHAAVFGKIEATKYLLSVGADPNTAIDTTQGTVRLVDSTTSPEIHTLLQGAIVKKSKVKHLH